MIWINYSLPILMYCIYPDFCPQAQASISKIKSASRSLPAAATSNGSARQQALQFTCAEVVDFAKGLAAALEENPASSLVAELAGNVANATGVVCSATEIAALAKADTDLNAAEASIQDELENVQDSLQGRVWA